MFWFFFQASILPPILIGQKHSIFELPSACGKTTALIIGMLQNINESIDEVQAIFLASNIHSAYSAWAVALSFSKHTNIKIALSVKDRTIAEEPYHVVIGTPMDIISRQANGMDFRGVTRIYADDADKTLPYNEIWLFIESMVKKPLIIASTAMLKKTIKQKFRSHNTFSIQRSQLIGPNITHLNMVCKTTAEKLEKVDEIKRALAGQKLLVICNVSISQRIAFFQWINIVNRFQWI